MKKFIVGLVIVLMIGLLVTGCAKKETAPVVPTTTTSAAAQPVLQEVAQAPEEVDKCGLNAVIAFTKCEKTADGNIQINIKNVGKAPISGMWYYIESKDGKVGYEKLDKTFALKEEAGFKVDTAKWTQKIGELHQVIVKPILDGKACNNQKKTVVLTADCQ